MTEREYERVCMKLGAQILEAAEAEPRCSHISIIAEPPDAPGTWVVLRMDALEKLGRIMAQEHEENVARESVRLREWLEHIASTNEAGRPCVSAALKALSSADYPPKPKET